MDHRWATAQLQTFVSKIDQLAKGAIEVMFEQVAAERLGKPTSPATIADDLIALDPVMRDLMNAARPGFGDYPHPVDEASDHYSPEYWKYTVKPWALRAIGVHNLGAEARERMKPDSPDLAADQLHPWVWKAAAPLWEAGNRPDAVHAAVNCPWAANSHTTSSSLRTRLTPRKTPSPSHPPHLG